VLAEPGGVDAVVRIELIAVGEVPVDLHDLVETASYRVEEGAEVTECRLEL